MSLQYLRSFNLQISTAAGGAVGFASSDLSGQAGEFRIQFRVARGDSQTPNSCDVRIFNLSDTTANQLSGKEFTQLTLSAGYPGTLGLIFRGVIKQVRKGRVDQKDNYVDLTAADGDQAYNFAPISKALAAGQATPQNAVELFLAMMATGAKLDDQGIASQAITAGYGADGKSLVLPTAATERARVYFGMVRDELREWADYNGVNWSIQDGKLTVIPKNSYIPTASVPLISVATGLIGVPEWQQGGLRIRTLLNPQVKIGQLIQLQAAAVSQYRYSLELGNYVTNANLARNTFTTRTDGTYYVMAVDHTGDSRGQEWYSDLLCLSADATVDPALAPYAVINPDASAVGGPVNN